MRVYLGRLQLSPAIRQRKLPSWVYLPSLSPHWVGPHVKGQKLHPSTLSEPYHPRPGISARTCHPASIKDMPHVCGKPVFKSRSLQHTELSENTQSCQPWELRAYPYGWNTLGLAGVQVEQDSAGASLPPGLLSGAERQAYKAYSATCNVLSTAPRRWPLAGVIQELKQTELSSPASTVPVYSRRSVPVSLRPLE